MIILFTHQLSTKEKTRQSVNNSQNSHITIQVNPFSQLDNYQEKQLIILSLDDDDDELIKLDTSASNFCENDSIELRLDQDLEYDHDITNETDT